MAKQRQPHGPPMTLGNLRSEPDLHEYQRLINRAHAQRRAPYREPGGTESWRTDLAIGVGRRWRGRAVYRRRCCSVCCWHGLNAMKYPPARLALKRPKPLRKTLIVPPIVYLPRKTTVSVEDAFWKPLKEIAAARNMGMHALVQEIDKKRQHANLSSAFHLFVLEYYRKRAR